MEDVFLKETHVFPLNHILQPNHHPEDLPMMVVVVDGTNKTRPSQKGSKSTSTLDTVKVYTTVHVHITY